MFLPETKIDRFLFVCLTFISKFIIFNFKANVSKSFTSGMKGDKLKNRNLNILCLFACERFFFSVLFELIQNEKKNVRKQKLI